MNCEQYSSSKPVLAYASGALVLGANNGASIDTQNYRSLTVPVALTITTGEVSAIGFEQSDDGSTGWAKTTEDTDLYYPDGFPLTGAGAKLIHVGSVAKKQYVRMVITCTGTVSIALDSAVALLQDSMVKPQVKESSAIADADIISPGTLADANTTAPKRT